MARFEREMRAVGKLTHENIVAAHDAGEIDGTHYLVMELLRGVDLSTVLKQQQTLPVADACEIIRQAAEGLQHAYENNLVHRDIKPSNLMLAAGGKEVQVKILDMGLALLEGQQAENADLTAAGQIMGTLDYMAPEQAGDTHAVDIRADNYSLGATLDKLLSGRVPFHGSNYNSTIAKLTALATQDPPRIDSLRADLPAELVEIVQRMLARQPEDRYDTPGELALALAPFAAGANLASLLESAAVAAEENVERTALLHTSAKAGESVSVRSSLVDTQSQVLAPGIHQPAALSEVSHSSQPAAPAVREHDVPRRRRNVLLACAALPLAVVLGVVLLSLRTPYGEIVVELAEGIPAEAAANLKIEVSGNGQLKVADEKVGWTIDIAEGKYQARLSGGSDRFELEPNQVTVTRGDKTLLKVWLKPAGQQPPSAHQASRSQPKTPSKPGDSLPPTFVNSIGMEFVLVPRGEFLMGGGGTPGKAKVHITRDYYLGKYEVTQETWEQIMGHNPSHFSRLRSGKDTVQDIADDDLKQFPVENVSWNDCQLFLEALNRREQESGWLYRLPTEAEWEYACRGGPSSNADDFSWHFYFDEPSNQLLPTQANFNLSGLMRTCKVGSYPPNRVGLCDMHGNIREWCDDETRTPAAASLRVHRGGVWSYESEHCQAAHHFADAPFHRSSKLGFRVARVPLGK